MKYFNVLLLVLVACTNDSSKTPEVRKRQLAEKSQWLVNNEDSLANYFFQKIKLDTASDNLRRVFFRAYQLDDGIFNTLNFRNKKLPRLHRN